MISRFALLLTASLSVAFAAPVFAQFSQDRSGYAPGVTDTVDSILARRITMTTLGRMNDQVHDIIDLYGEEQEEKARANLDAIGVFLLGFPEMFPEGSYRYSKELEAEEPATVTWALPAVWENWDDFYSRSLVAAETAYQAGRASSWDEMVRLTEELEVQCESCHAAYRQEAVAIEPEALGLEPPMAN